MTRKNASDSIAPLMLAMNVRFGGRHRWTGFFYWTAMVTLAAWLPACNTEKQKKEADGASAAAAFTPEQTGSEQAVPSATEAAAATEEGEPAPVEPGVVKTPAEDAEPDSPAAAPAEKVEENGGGKVVLRATGRAKKGRDVSLARDAAAERARAQLMKIMKQKGYLDAASEHLEGATIERFYFRGRYVYAVAAIEVEKVNESGAPASKSSEEQGVQRQEPHGGTK